MSYKHHTAGYQLGERELKPEERVVVGTRIGPKEPRRIAKHLGLSELQPHLLIDHKIWSDEEYLPTFVTKNCLLRDDFFRYKENYKNADGSIKWGEGLKGKTVYIVHTFSENFTPQDLDKRIEFIAHTAKYNGAENVVLVAYTLDHSAQERGVHDIEHPRMQDEEALKKFDGQAPISRLQLQQYMTSGVDTIITPHNHCPEDTQSLCDDVNQEFEIMYKRSLDLNSTLRYHLKFVNVDLAPMVGMFISDYGESNLNFDLSDSGRNVLFLGPDVGITTFITNTRRHSGLRNSALAIMEKKRAEDGVGITYLQLNHSEGLTLERGIEGMDIIVADDAIRTGSTVQRNIRVLRGGTIEDLVLDPKIKGKPRKVAVYSTRTNFAGNSVKILASPAIDDVIITNADPRGIKNVGELDVKTQMIWINFMMAEASKAIERGEDPNKILTPEYIRRRKLLKVNVPHGHKSLADLEGSGII